ncbi:hypothetical protein AGMMS49938_03530 [Fibrobacterales bacterium]|nr:hypothetical protein AGMMS49938_03530 [Fibrobacterales bacterium]
MKTFKENLEELGLLENDFLDSKEEFKKYLHAQVDEILKHRWIKSEKVGDDLGHKAEEEWIELFSREFRKLHWDKERKTFIP